MRLLVLALVAVLLFPVAAQASDLEITWPERRAYEPGEKLTVRIASDRPVKAVLVRESSSGHVLRAVARGRFAPASSASSRRAPGATPCRLTVGGRSYRRHVTVTQPTRCDSVRGDRAELRLGATTATAGGVLPYTS